MTSNQQPKQLSNDLADEAIQALGLLDLEDQKKVLDYINAIVDDYENEQGNN